MTSSEALARRNRRTLFGAMGFVGFMVGVSFAAVPSMGVPPKPVARQNRS